MENKYIIDEKLRDALLNYLMEKPYKEVFQGIHALQNLKKLDEKLIEEQDEKVKEFLGKDK